MPHNSTEPNTKIYAIGDIHGCLELLNSLLKWIEGDVQTSEAERHVLVFLGDYVDRGPHIKAVMERLVSGFPFVDDTIYIRGNHEATLYQFLSGEDVSWNWFKYGGLETLQSYGLTPPTDDEEASAMQAVLRNELSPIFPIHHRKFLKDDLRLTWINGDYLFVHAGLRPGIELADQSEHDLTWIRDEFMDSDVDFGKIIVHGHTITPTPDVKANRIGIDTGGFANGLLTCLALEGTSRQFIFATDSGVQAQDVF
jgi:serine/threonine protein phosphatase 1